MLRCYASTSEKSVLKARGYIYTKEDNIEVKVYPKADQRPLNGICGKSRMGYRFCYFSFGLEQIKWDWKRFSITFQVSRFSSVWML